MQSSYSCAAYGEDYSSLLVKDILSVRKYWCDMSPQQWHGEKLLRLSIFRNPNILTPPPDLPPYAPQISWNCIVTCSSLRPSQLTVFS